VHNTISKDLTKQKLEHSSFYIPFIQNLRAKLQDDNLYPNTNSTFCHSLYKEGECSIGYSGAQRIILFISFLLNKRLVRKTLSIFFSKA